MNHSLLVKRMDTMDRKMSMMNKDLTMGMNLRKKFVTKKVMPKEMTGDSESLRERLLV